MVQPVCFGLDGGNQWYSERMAEKIITAVERRLDLFRPFLRFVVIVVESTTRQSIPLRSRKDSKRPMKLFFLVQCRRIYYRWIEFGGGGGGSHARTGRHE